MIPALISAAVALLIFTIGRLFEYRAIQSNFLRVKLEEFFICLEAFHEHSKMPYVDPDGEDNDLKRFGVAMTEQAGKLARSINRPHMLAHLYFPDAVPRFERVVVAVGSVNNWMHDYADPSLPYDIGHGTEQFNRLNDEMVVLKNYLRDQQASLTMRLGHAWQD